MTQQTEGFERPRLTMQDIKALLEDIDTQAYNHLVNYGDGIFLHPHELVGCMYGQLMKLSQAADASIYNGDLAECEERCMKMLMAMVSGTVSMSKLSELREQ